MGNEGTERGRERETERKREREREISKLRSVVARKDLKQSYFQRLRGSSTNLVKRLTWHYAVSPLSRFVKCAGSVEWCVVVACCGSFTQP